FLTVIMALLGGATSVWGPMLGVVPLVLISDFLSVTMPSYFSVVLGLVLLGIVFLIPNGLIGLLQAGRARLGARSLSDLLHALGDRIGGRGAGGAAVRCGPRPAVPFAAHAVGRNEGAMTAASLPLLEIIGLTRHFGGLA